MTTHHIHHDPAVRALIAREVAAAEQRGAERVAQAVERARKVLDGWEHDGPDGYEFHLLILRVREALDGGVE